jgi:hypothetical protein
MCLHLLQNKFQLRINLVFQLQKLHKKILQGKASKSWHLMANMFLRHRL